MVVSARPFPPSISSCNWANRVESWGRSYAFFGAEQVRLCFEIVEQGSQAMGSRQMGGDALFIGGKLAKIGGEQVGHQLLCNGGHYPAGVFIKRPGRGFANGFGWGQQQRKLTLAGGNYRCEGRKNEVGHEGNGRFRHIP